MATYLAYKLTQQDKVILETHGLLSWWHSKTSKKDGWPTIAQVVRDVLCEPASSSKSECNFSESGNTVTNKRNLIHPAKVNDLMFLRSALLSMPTHMSRK